VESHSLEAIFSGIRALNVGVIGDFALDMYYNECGPIGENSLETGRPVSGATAPRTAPGAAGNLAKNLAAWHPASLHLFGIIGDDIFGRELHRHCTALGARCDYLVGQGREWTTYAYIKPMREGVEQDRLDFGVANRMSDATVAHVLDGLEREIERLDVLFINQQIRPSLLCAGTTQRLNSIIARGRLVLADCRSYATRLRNAIIKMNTRELAAALGRDEPDPRSDRECASAAMAARAHLNNPVLLTRGEYGLVFVAADNTTHAVPGLAIIAETDAVGAGDACISALGAALATGAPVAEALHFANLAAAVTVTKTGETGTASVEEIGELHREQTYIYNADTADDVRTARYLDASEIEVIRAPAESTIRAAILDHDGTISTLRQGWEKVMFDVCMECVCGAGNSAPAPAVSSDRFRRIQDRVRRMIEATTGVQTIRQMQLLADMVRSEGIVRRDALRGPAEYKALYLQRLLEEVKRRIVKLRTGELRPEDFTMNGAKKFIEMLRQKGCTVFLASGTDQQDVEAEAEALGYAHLFNGGIFGSRGNEIGDAKRLVLRHILSSMSVSGDAILIAGDGPMEMREGKQVGAICLGVASDEIRRYGLNADKRRRLIRAGADVIVPDFSQCDQLVKCLFC